MKKKTTKQVACGVLAALTFSLGYAQTAYVAGPIERISHESSQLTVLGQTYLVNDSTAIIGATKRSVGFATIQAFEVGSLVAIESGVVTSSARATSVTIARTQYVPGATQVFVAGKVEQVSASIGTLRIGNLKIDVSNISSTLVSLIRVGSYVEICGIQPSPTDVLIGQELLVGKSHGLAIDNIAGGNESIAGTGAEAQSIAGTGAEVQSIAGTGKISIAGTGAEMQSIAGTGKISIAGTGAEVQSIAGTGKISIAGTGAEVQSIAGTGKLSISGTGVLSIAGTGAEAQSVAGNAALRNAGTGSL